VAVAAMLWALVFAALHLAWAFGWYVGLDAVAATAAFSRPWFLAYDLAVAAGCLVTGVACGVVARHRRPPMRATRMICLGAAIIVGARAAAGVGALAWRVSTSGNAGAIYWESWFVVGAVVLAKTARK
jgi:hypothetical protein